MNGNRARSNCVAPQADARHGPVVLNLSVVLPNMQYRKQLRYFNGLYVPPDNYRLLFLLLIVLLLWAFKSGFERRTPTSYDYGIVLSLSFDFGRDSGDPAAHIAVNVITYLFTLLTVYLVAVHVNRYDPFMQVLCVVCLIILVVTLSRKDRMREDGPYGFLSSQDLVMQVFVLAALLHMAMLSVIRALVPALVRRGSLLARSSIWERRDLIEPATVASLIAFPTGYTLAPNRRLVACYFKYKTPWWMPFLGHQEAITYVGEVDDEGYPTGYGEWRDSHWHGEHLTGFWHGGRPTGPFRSRETGSASGFINLRVAYFRNRGEELRKAACLPRLLPLQFGIVACEVSTSGAWFRSLPRLSELLPPVDVAEGLQAEEEAALEEGRMRPAAPSLSSPLLHLRSGIQRLTSMQTSSSPRGNAPDGATGGISGGRQGSHLWKSPSYSRSSVPLELFTSTLYQQQQQQQLQPLHASVRVRGPTGFASEPLPAAAGPGLSPTATSHFPTPFRDAQVQAMLPQASSRHPAVSATGAPTGASPTFRDARGQLVSMGPQISVQSSDTLAPGSSPHFPKALAHSRQLPAGLSSAAPHPMSYRPRLVTIEGSVIRDVLRGLKQAEAYLRAPSLRKPGGAATAGDAASRGPATTQEGLLPVASTPFATASPTPATAPRPAAVPAPTATVPRPATASTPLVAPISAATAPTPASEPEPETSTTSLAQADVATSTPAFFHWEVRLPRLVSMLMPLQPAPTTSLCKQDTFPTPALKLRGKTASRSTATRAWLKTWARALKPGRPVPGLPSSLASPTLSQRGLPIERAVSSPEEALSRRRGLRLRLRRPLTTPQLGSSLRPSTFSSVVATDGSGGDRCGPVHPRALASFIRSSQPFVPGGSGTPAGSGGRPSGRVSERRGSGRDMRIEDGALEPGLSGKGPTRSRPEVGGSSFMDRQAQEAVAAQGVGVVGDERFGESSQRWGRSERELEGGAGATASVARELRSGGPLIHPTAELFSPDRQPQAVLFVHGLGVDMHKALRHYAQMLALIGFPPHISPVLFSWPASVPLGYFWARYRGAEAPETGLALAAAVRALAADGFSGLHILVHSMGTRVLMNALPHLEAILGVAAAGSGEQEPAGGGAEGTEGADHHGERRKAAECGREGAGPCRGAVRPGGRGDGMAVPGQRGGMKLQSVTICNPDYGLRRFTEEMGPRLRALCPQVTLYGDAADGALAVSEVVNALARPFVDAGVALADAGTAAATAVGSHAKSAAATLYDNLVHRGKASNNRTTPEPAQRNMHRAVSGCAQRGQRNGGSPSIPASGPHVSSRAPQPRAALQPPTTLGIQDPDTVSDVAVVLEVVGTSSSTEPQAGTAPGRAPNSATQPRQLSQADKETREELMAEWVTQAQPAPPPAPLVPPPPPPPPLPSPPPAAVLPASLEVASDGDGAGEVSFSGARLVSAVMTAEAVATTSSINTDLSADRGAADGTSGEDLTWWSERVVNYRRRIRKPPFYSWLEHSLGRRIYQVVDPATKLPLDIDVIDMSYLYSNVNSLRHTHFSLNREILDDLWEVIVLGRRAAQRKSRLEHVTGNVYSMAVAPSYLSSKQI